MTRSRPMALAHIGTVHLDAFLQADNTPALVRDLVSVCEHPDLTSEARLFRVCHIAAKLALIDEIRTARDAAERSR